MTKEERKTKREYFKKLKATRKKLMKAAKEWGPWDHGYAIDLFITSIEGFKWYYEQSYNVMAEDDKDMPRAEKCKLILEAFNDYLECEDWTIEIDKWNEFWDLVKKYLLFLWD